MSYNNLQKEKLSILATTATSGDIVQWDGADWVNVNFPFDLTGIASGDILVFNGVEFVAQEIPSNIEKKEITTNTIFTASDFLKDITIIHVDCNAGQVSIELPDPSTLTEPKIITVFNADDGGAFRSVNITLNNNGSDGSDGKSYFDILNKQYDSITYSVGGGGYGLIYTVISRKNKKTDTNLSPIITTNLILEYEGSKTYIARVDSNSGARTITLPSNFAMDLVGVNLDFFPEIVIKDFGYNSLVNNITVLPTAGEKIEGIVNGTLVIAQNGGSYRLAYDKANSNWMVI